MSAPVTLIPVIDLLGGQVVRGVRGDRKAYRPIESALCSSSDPLTVAAILTDHCATQQLYVADLDALMGASAQQAVLRALLSHLPRLELWLDAGFADAAQAQALIENFGRDGARIVPVFASESLASREVLAACFAPSAPLAERAALSLDRRGSERLDAAGCWDADALWPKRVIVMTLERVGSGAGPDLDTMAALRRRAPNAMLIGAGGVRSAGDLALAAEAGADAWLVASALHDRQIPPAAR